VRNIIQLLKFDGETYNKLTFSLSRMIECKRCERYFKLPSIVIWIIQFKKCHR